MNKHSRRAFLKISGAVAAGAILSSTACAGNKAAAPQPTSIPATETPVTQASTATSQPVLPTATTGETPQPTATLAGKAYRRPELIQFYPARKSQVVRARSTTAWKGDALEAGSVRQMVDKAITTLTGAKEPKQAWRALFEPTEKIAIKLNVFRNSLIWTHPALVKAVTDGLQEAGIPAENITLFDYYTDELKTAGYTVNKDGPGVRCYGSDVDYTEVEMGKRSVKMSNILLEADALINMPVLKSHMMAGLTFALKNHYGSVESPGALHYIAGYLGPLNAVSAIKDATRLVIGDALEACTKYASFFPYWEADARGDSILMSFDPVAHDRVGLDLLTKMAEEKGNSTEAILGMCEQWLKTIDDYGIGTSKKENIELVEV